MKIPTAAVLIIGREILTGKFADENGPFLIRRLRALGTSLERMVVLDDDLDAIGDEVRRCGQMFDHVITTGGVGPTHDDVTLEGVARGLGVELVLDQRVIVQLEHYGIPIDAATERMALLPEGSELIAAGPHSFPVVRVQNIWIFPGVPKLLQRKFAGIEEAFRGPVQYVRRLHVDQDEMLIAAALTDLAARHPHVDIGSYPRFGVGEAKVILTCEGADADAFHAAVADLRTTFMVIDED